MGIDLGFTDCTKASDSIVREAAGGSAARSRLECFVESHAALTVKSADLTFTPKWTITSALPIRIRVRAKVPTSTSTAMLSAALSRPRTCARRQTRWQPPELKFRRKLQANDDNFVYAQIDCRYSLLDAPPMQYNTVISNSMIIHVEPPQRRFISCPASTSQSAFEYHPR